MTKGGKFIFGKSKIQSDGTVQFPTQAVQEYDIAAEGKVYIFTGSKSTGGFCVTRKGLLEKSKLSHILSENKSLSDFSLATGEFIKYKGRSYCWTEISQDGKIVLTEKMRLYLKLEQGMKLLCIRSSDIAFTMGAFGPIVEKSNQFGGEIPLF